MAPEVRTYHVMHLNYSNLDNHVYAKMHNSGTVVVESRCTILLCVVNNIIYYW